MWEARRDRLYQTLVALGDFRRGTISVNYRRCGKPNCACARAEHPGHGPQYLWNATMGGKSRARNLRVGPELEKVGQEVETYRAFVRLCAELVEVNERICELRPMRVVDDAQELAAVKKKIAQAVRQEGAAEGARLVARVLADGQRRGALDLEASEMALRAAMHQVGGTVLAHLLNADRGGVREARIACGQGQEAALVDYRSKEVLTVLGPVSVQRAYYHCARCRSGVIPKDRALDILGTSFSPGVRRMMGRVGAKEAFATGRQDLEELAGIVVKTKAVERIAEALGQQIETAGQAARAAAVGPAPWCRSRSCRPSTLPSTGRACRWSPGRPGGTRARLRRVKPRPARPSWGASSPRPGLMAGGARCATMPRPPTSGPSSRPRHLASACTPRRCGRGVTRAERVIALGDGAPWIWGLADEHFPGAIQIVDLYHAREHLAAVGRLVYGPASAAATDWAAGRSEQLDAGDLAGVLAALGRLRPRRAELQAEIRKAIGYFRTHAPRMRYAHFRSQGLFVGSGVVEASCKTIIGQRLKQSGMRWTVRGANAIIALRCAELSGRWEEFWEARSAG